MNTRAPILVTPKTFWESRTAIYNAVKSFIGYISAVLGLLVTFSGNGNLPFAVDVRWLLLGIAFLAITDGHVGMWLRSQTDAPIVSKES